MKKTGMIAGISFLAGALFIVLTLGYFQGDPGSMELTPALVHAQDDSPLQVGKGFSFAPLVKKVRSAVVKVTSESLSRRGRGNDDIFERFFNYRRRGREKQKVTGMGSGFFISADGYILTNNHVVQDAIKIKITDINKKEYVAKKVGADPRSDLALLKIVGKNFPYIPMGNSENLEVGEWVLAIGNPLGQDLSVTSGIVSAKGRELRGLDVAFQNFIQTDASINQGNSGGPLINMNGEAIGVNSAILSTSGGSIGIGFAIPSNMAKKVIGDLKKEGRVIRGYIGVSIVEISDSEAGQYDLPSGGVLIQSVEKGTPAREAGLKSYDLIVKINGKSVKSLTELRNIIAAHSPGETVKLTIYRDKKEMTVPVKVAESPDSVTIRSEDGDGGVIDLGMVIRNNSRDLARQYELATSNGIVITEITRGGVASEHSLRAGDVIIAVTRTQIDSVKQFRKIMSEKSGSRVILIINRDGQEYFVKFSVPGK